jgi:hypothetical protein
MKKHLALLFLTAALAGCLELGPGEGSGELASPLLSRDALVFNAGGHIPSDTRSVTLNNPSAAPLNVSNLTITGEDAGRFSLGDAAPFSLEAGESREVTLTFTPGAELGPHRASLRLTYGGGAGSAQLPVQEVYLGGLSVEGQEGTLEPSLQWIFDTYGFPVQTGDEDPTDSALVGEVTNSPVGDEVVAQTFRRADPAQPVTVEVIATFAVPDVEPVFEFGYYRAGTAEPSLQRLLSIPVAPTLNGQRLEPEIVPAVSEVREGVVGFDPPEGVFGFYSFWPTTRFFDQRTVFTEDARNVFENATPHHVRTYPLLGRDGERVENAYILATDESNRLNDYNDAVLIVRNVEPAGPVAAP